MAVASLTNFTVPLAAGGASQTGQGLLMPKLKYRFRLSFVNFGVSTNNVIELTKQVSEWAPKTVIGFKVNSVSAQKPQSISPSQLSRTVNGLLGENFVVEDVDNKFIIHNGKITLEVTNLYAEKN